MNLEFLETLLNTAVGAGTPLLLGTLGEIYAERSGVLNLGVEGMMIIGAITGFSTTLNTGNPWIGVVLAAIASGILALIHAFVTITLRANQIVSGLAITMFGLGLSGLLGKSYVGLPLPSPIRPIPIPILSSIPIFGPFLFKHDLLVYVSLILVPILWIILF
ncbi:MAG: ABC transporter permease, partial [Candidatus Bathyarchaeia archaeon]